jgi:hypothetical protein
VVNSLSRWLKKAPQPTKVRYVTEDGEERLLVVGTNTRRWKEAEAALEGAGAVRVEALDDKDTVLRIEVLREVEGDEKPGAAETARAKDTAAMALVLDAHGKRMTEAFREGAEAASRGQDNLVQVVNILTAQWTGTMNALQSLAMQLNKAIRAQGLQDGEDDDGTGQQMTQLLTMMAAKYLGGGGEANGTAKKEK